MVQKMTKILEEFETYDLLENMIKLSPLSLFSSLHYTNLKLMRSRLNMIVQVLFYSRHFSIFKNKNGILLCT